MKPSLRQFLAVAAVCLAHLSPFPSAAACVGVHCRNQQVQGQARTRIFEDAPAQAPCIARPLSPSRNWRLPAAVFCLRGERMFASEREIYTVLCSSIVWCRAGRVHRPHPCLITIRLVPQACLLRQYSPSSQSPIGITRLCPTCCRFLARGHDACALAGGSEETSSDPTGSAADESSAREPPKEEWLPAAEEAALLQEKGGADPEALS